MAGSTQKSLLYGSILLGILAFVLNFVYLREKASGGTVDYVIAKRSIRFGEIIDHRNDLIDVAVPAEVAKYIGQRYLTSARFDATRGKLAQWDVGRGEFISESTIGQGILDFDLDSLHSDERLISITVDEVSSVGYRIHRGDRIDIYPSISSEYPKPVLEFVEVATVGSESNLRTSEGVTYRTIGLLVTKDQAEEIIKYQSGGGGYFRITLRSSILR